MKLVSFNVENLFERPRVMSQGNWEDNRAALDQYAKLNAILRKPVYTAADKRKIAALLTEMGLAKADENKLFRLRQNRGHLVKRPREGGLQVVASGRDSWVGWVELQKAEVDELSIRHTARVIAELDADVFAVVEAEDRIALCRFNATVLKAAGGKPFEEIMLIDGNDERGIDVGIMLRSGYKLTGMRSSVHDEDGAGLSIFSRDCPIYRLKTPKDSEVFVLINHFKSKGFGTPAESNAKRRKQAERVAEIYREIVSANRNPLVAVVGDLNDTPASAPLKPLVKDTDLVEVASIAGFDDGGRPGTYGGSTAGNKIDYILCSPALFAKAERGGYFRRGMWPGVRPKKWEAFPEITEEIHAASDHAAVWAEFDV